MDFLWNRTGALLMSLLVIPSGKDWLITIFSLVIFGLAAYPVATRSGFARRAPSSRRLPERILLGVRTLFHPALLEEAFYRGLLLPPLATPFPQGSDIAWLSLSLLVFIIAHPINGLVHKAARPTLSHPGFLFLAGLLGLSTSLLYWSSGSLWPAIFFHWIVVYVWIDKFGGEKALKRVT